jgi:hypothetical protein
MSLTKACAAPATPSICGKSCAAAAAAAAVGSARHAPALLSCLTVLLLSPRRVTDALKEPQPDIAKSEWSDIPTLKACKRLVQRVNQSSATRKAFRDRQVELAKEDRDRAARERQEKAAAAAVAAAAAAGLPDVPEPLDLLEPLADLPEEDGLTTSELATPLKLIKHVVTRWGSAYMMMERMFKLRHACEWILNNKFKKLAKKIDWKTVDGLLKLLKPFYLATQQLQGEHYPTMSRVWYHLEALRWQCERVNFDRYPQEVRDVRDRLLHSMNRVPAANEGQLKVTPFLQLCTLVDPTMKVRVRCVRRGVHERLNACTYVAGCGDLHHQW